MQKPTCPSKAGRQREPDPVAAHISELAAELAALAHRHGHQTLAYLLQMARLEADNINGR